MPDDIKSSINSLWGDKAFNSGTQSERLKRNLIQSEGSDKKQGNFDI